MECAPPPLRFLDGICSLFDSSVADFHLKRSGCQRVELLLVLWIDSLVFLLNPRCFHRCLIGRRVVFCLMLLLISGSYRQGTLRKAAAPEVKILNVAWCSVAQVSVPVGLLAKGFPWHYFIFNTWREPQRSLRRTFTCHFCLLTKCFCLTNKFKTVFRTYYQSWSLLIMECWCKSFKHQIEIFSCSDYLAYFWCLINVDVQ